MICHKRLPSERTFARFPVRNPATANALSPIFPRRNPATANALSPASLSAIRPPRTHFRPPSPVANPTVTNGSECVLPQPKGPTGRRPPPKKSPPPSLRKTAVTGVLTGFNSHYIPSAFPSGSVASPSMGSAESSHGSTVTSPGLTTSRPMVRLIVVTLPPARLMSEPCV